MRPNGLALARWPAYFLLALGLMTVAAPRTDLNPRSRLIDMVAGTAWRPYVKRALVGWTVRAADLLMPDAIEHALDEQVAKSPYFRERLRWQPVHASWFLMVWLIHLAALLVFAVMLERWYALVSGCGPHTAFAAGLAGLAMLPIHFGYQNFLYDFSTLALFTLGLLLISRRSWNALYFLWPIGLMNKETFVLLTLVFVAFEWGRMRRTELATHLLAQATIACVVLFSIGWVFRDNPGPPVEWHLTRNLAMRPPLRQLVHDAVYWGFVLFAFLGWKRRPRLALAALAVLLVLFGTTFFFGFLGEYRDFYEAWPLILAMAMTSVEGLRGRVRTPAAVPAA